jgi:tetratricopeptide (TPR) repeat protein
VAQLSTRRDFKASIALGLQALQRLQPVLDRPDAPRAARQTEGVILQSTGFSQLRDMQRPAAAVTLRRALAVFRGLGATELEDLVATTGYIRTSWLLEEAIDRTGSVAERRALLEEGVALADRLLAVRPGHRPALRAKATTLNGLSQIAQEELQVAKAVQSLTAALDVETQALSLDAGSGASRNNMRIRYGQRSYLLSMLGRFDEARRDAELGLQVGQDEGVDSFGKFNLAFSNFETGVFYADLGEDARADALQREGDRLVEDLQRDGGFDLAALAIRRATTAGRIALARRDRAALSVVRRDLDVAKARFLADNPDDPAVDGLARVASGASAEVALALGDAVAAEGYARQSIEESKRFGVSGYYERRDAAAVLAMLSLALSAQGKLADASEAIRPALAFHLEPLVRASDDQMLKADHARVLYAAALASADPARRRAYLVEAAQRFDSMPAPLRQLKSFAALRADIARALQG